MYVSDKLFYILLGLFSSILLGMLFGSWRVILYSYLLIIGLSLCIGMWRSIIKAPKKILIPLSISAIYYILFVTIDILLTTKNDSINNLFLGLTPTMALLLLGILPTAFILCLIYALIFQKEKKDIPESPILKEEA